MPISSEQPRAAGLARAASSGADIESVRILADAESRRGNALFQVGRPEEGRRALEAAIALSESAADLDSLRRIHSNLGEIYLVRADLAQSLEHFRRAHAVAHRTGNPARIAPTLANVGYTLYYLGDWAAARGHFAHAVDIAHAISSWQGVYPPPARDRMREALAIFRRLGARRAIERTREAFARLEG